MARGAARPKDTPDDPRFRRLVIALPPELDEALRQRAEEQERPLAWIIRKALQEHLGFELSRPSAA